MSKMQQDLLNILPELSILLTAVMALIFEMVRKPLISLWLMISGLLISTGIAISYLGKHITVFHETWRVDDLSLWAAILLCPAAILCALLARAEMKGTIREGTVYTLMTFAVLASVLLAGSGDMMFLVLGTLMSGLCGFAMVAILQNPLSTEGAMKYFVFGSVSGAIMLFGLTYWAGAIGTTYLNSLIELKNYPFIAVFGFVTLLIGLGYAASIFPFHFWTPDAFEGAPVSIAAFISVVPKIGILFALAQVVKSLSATTVHWQMILAILAVATMTYGNVVALVQKKTIRLLSYSTVAQAGFFLLGIVAWEKSTMALHSLIVFGAAYAVMNIGAFSMILSTGNEVHSFKGMAAKQPWAAVGMSIFLLSLVGVPPLAGFAGKLLLFGAAIDAGFGWLAIVAILNSVISLGVYLKIIIPIFSEGQFQPKHQSWFFHFSWISCLLLTLAIGFGVQIIIKSV